MTDEERLDIIEGEDEDGNPMLLNVERYFYYNGDEYVLLRQVDNENGDSSDERLYVMLVQVSKDEDGEEIEDFVPVEDELQEALIRAARTVFIDGAADGDPGLNE